MRVDGVFQEKLLLLPWSWASAQAHLTCTMVLRVIVICSAAGSLVLYLLAIIITTWPCGGLFRGCQDKFGPSYEIYNYHVIGGLFITCTIAIGISLLFALIALGVEARFVRVVSCCAAFVAFVLGLTAEVVFYTRIRYDWAALLSAVGMTLCFGVTVVQIGYLITVKLFKAEHYTPEFM